MREPGGRPAAPVPPIPAALRDLFAPVIRARGEEYFRAGRVAITHADAMRLLATVRGTHAYSVELDASAGLLGISCSCPAAPQDGTCKHLWATLLAAQEAGLLAPLLDSLDETEALAARADGVPVPDEAGRPVRPVSPPPWRAVLDGVRAREAHRSAPPRPAPWPADRRLVYVVDLKASSGAAGLVVELAMERRLDDGSWDAPKPYRLGLDAWLHHPAPDDRIIAQMLLGAWPEAHYWTRGASTPPPSFLLGRDALDSTLRLICGTARCRLRRDRGDRPIAVTLDDGPPWRFTLRLVRRDGAAGGGHVLTGCFRRDGAEMPLDEPEVVHGAGILFVGQRLARFEYDGSFDLVAELRRAPLAIERDAEVPAALEALFGLKRLPPLELPPGAEIHECSPAPVPCVAVSARRGMTWGRPAYDLVLSFDYGDDLLIRPRDARPAVFDPRTMRLVHRSPDAEAAAMERLQALGARQPYRFDGSLAELEIGAPRVERLLRELSREGWRLEAEGVRYRELTDVRTVVRSGIDWFDVGTTLSFGEARVPLARVADAVRDGADSVPLDDGSRGLLPAEWRRRLAPLVATGEAAGEAMRYRRSQTALLDVLLATLPEVDVDAAFRTAREALQSFDRIAPADAPASFAAGLRPYQREGLGWLHFLRRFSLGGCLADDMGLGKTVQVLALLEARRLEGAGPSLVVVPKSLVFNWQQEAARFAPGLRVLDHTGRARRAAPPEPGAADVVVTTYGTLRRDITQLREIEFDYVVLDEAQAIKNAGTAAAKAARLLRARHRLALSGTPVENRIEELWSIMEFLNPGMLGRSAVFARLVKPGRASSDDADARLLLSRALRPVILRRTKAQVAAELPERIEQTLYVDLEPAQRKFYDALLAQYRAELLPHVDRVGIARSKLRILEALLRLRQAALHPALVDGRGRPAPVRASASAKLDVLLPRLADARAEEHKALVFSQFTSFLALLRAQLDAEGIPYAYLDGSTRDRAAQVERFQSDPGCGLFLVSLKAGGHGLNLTAAEYVFLLDPWWNPAVEAQAIDRAHRIGQTRHVIATRLVARDTIEEKILALQQSKRELADAILGADEGFVSRIGRAELALLLG